MVVQMLLVNSLSLLQAVPQIPNGATTDQLDREIALEAIRQHGGRLGSLTGILVPMALFAFILALVWLGTRKKQAQIQARAEFHKQLLDKFSSGREFSEFLESKGSQRFLDELWSQGLGAKERVLSTMRTGIILAALGLALLGLTLVNHHLVFPAVIVLALGIGYLAATAISYRVSKRWAQTEGSQTGSV
jgi:hypothetical protein